MANSQCDRILQHMKSHGSITPLEAFNLYKSLACHSRIAELRERGHVIATEMIETPSGKVIGKYTLQSRHTAPQRAQTPAMPLVTYKPVIMCFGKRVEVVAEGVSAYDGCHWMSVREIGR